MRTRLVVGALAGLVVALAAYWFVVREDVAEPRVLVPRLAATIGEGSEALGVSGSGAIVRWLPLPEDPPLPQLPLDEVPKGGHLRGPALEQVRVLAAVPEALRPYVESSAFGSHGVTAYLTTGVELRFGNASQARRKWRAAAAVLADPAVTSPGYVDVEAPDRPAYDSSGEELPPPP